MNSTIAAICVILVALLLAKACESVRPGLDCRVLIGGWHPDVPARIAEKCRP